LEASWLRRLAWSWRTARAVSRSPGTATGAQGHGLARWGEAVAIATAR
jgi:hypothetical protein